MKYIDARFLDGVFRPIEPIELESGTRILLGFVEVSRPGVESRTPDELSKLELDILNAVHDWKIKDLDEILEDVNHSVCFNNKRKKLKLREVTRERVERGLRSLIDMGYVQMAPPPETPDLFRVTPKGKVTMVHRRQAWWAARKGRPQPVSPKLEDISPRFEDLDIGLLDLCTRVRNVLKAHRILTLGDVCRLSAKELLEVRGVGKKGVEEIECELDTMGLRLKQARTRHRGL